MDVVVCGRAASGRCPPGWVLRTAGRAPFTVVVDREDDVHVTRTVLAAHQPAAGQVVVHPTVGGEGRLLWHDVLHAVSGRLPDRPSRAGSAGRAEQEHAVRAALEAGDVRRLTVLRGHRVPLGVWADLVALHRATGTDVSVVHHAPLPVDLAHLLRHCDHRMVTTRAAVQALYPPARP
ncbi:hypothetical protein [Streptomyces fuscichromogenes]|uniref:Uncharacterized protein n=1 Tax=Streptomyces fuscichromogenes TaxID=1324013 RepID=A0A918CXS1_9ACTN|nr:hypothetical protein [Streptomyces fuscichromogenes]GGN45876.1 hypothetical protein GCM10011578_098250 [Streptomyces fuscichromogenes]